MKLQDYSLTVILSGARDVSRFKLMNHMMCQVICHEVESDGNHDTNTIKMFETTKSKIKSSKRDDLLNDNFLKSRVDSYQSQKLNSDTLTKLVTKLERTKT